MAPEPGDAGTGAGSTAGPADDQRAADKVAADAKAAADKVATDAKAVADRASTDAKAAADKSSADAKAAAAKPAGDANAEWLRAKEAADKIEARLNAGIERERLRTLRRLGADPELIGDADLLVLAPRVDAEEPAGMTALHAFKAARPAWFRRVAAGPQEELATRTAAVAADARLAPATKARKAEMTKRLFGGK